MAKKKKKKKTGHVAIPFLIALLLGIVGIGGVAMFVFKKINANNGPEIKEMTTSITKPTAENNMSLLFVLDENGNESLQNATQLTFVVVRVLPAEKKMVFLCFPDNMLAVVDGRNDTLANFYRNSGIQATKAAIEDQAGIVVDRYMILDSESFGKICTIYGGVYYAVPTGTVGFVESKDPQYLGPPQIEKLITYSIYEQGEIQRTAITSDVLAEMINLTDKERIVSTMDANFRTLVNKCVDTDITSVDYSDQKNALKYMYTYGNTIASFRMVTGQMGENSDVFMISDNFQRSVADLFDDAPKSSKPASTEPADATPAEDGSAAEETAAEGEESEAAEGDASTEE
ncbi:MAG: LCP family protein [Oscillospiraceae bacterium]|nr:LCP family protein [Oscillospiraceae bacterium]